MYAQLDMARCLVCNGDPRWLYRDCGSGAVACGDCVRKIAAAERRKMYPDTRELYGVEPKAAPKWCKRGHPWAENTYIHPNGSRRCKACAVTLRRIARPLKGKPPLKTHCPSGHAYAGDNLIQDKRGTRRCRICSNLESKMRRLRKLGRAA